MSKKLEGIRAVIFDMDGVLFLSDECHAQAYTETLREVGIRSFAYPAVAGMRTDEAMQQILIANGIDPDPSLVDRLVSTKRKKAATLLEQNASIDHEGKELVLSLRSHYRLALASSASRATVDFFLARSGYGDAFEFSLDGSSVSRAKPHPDIYRLAMDKLGLDPSACLVIEDSTSGIQAALAAGAQVIAINRGKSQDIQNQPGTVMMVRGLAAIRNFLP